MPSMDLVIRGEGGEPPGRGSLQLFRSVQYCLALVFIPKSLFSCSRSSIHLQNASRTFVPVCKPLFHWRSEAIVAQFLACQGNKVPWQKYRKRQLKTWGRLVLMHDSNSFTHGLSDIKDNPRIPIRPQQRLFLSSFIQHRQTSGIPACRCHGRSIGSRSREWRHGILFLVGEGLGPFARRLWACETPETPLARRAEAIACAQEHIYTQGLRHPVLFPLCPHLVPSRYPFISPSILPIDPSPSAPVTR